MSGDDARSFNLIDQPWILARAVDGHVREWSLTELVEHAHELQCLVGDVPTQVFALTRLLLAVIHRATGGPADIDAWERLWTASTLPVEPIREYLNRHRSRFDLLHPDTPFYQVADLRTAKGEMSDLSKLIADVPNGKPFFSSRPSPHVSLTFAEAARWVVHCQAFDPSGIKSGAVGDPRAKNGKGYPIGIGWAGLLGGVLAEGATLRETLLLNLLTADFADLAQWRDRDAPAWERPPNGPAPDFADDDTERAPDGPLDLYTWQSRRIRLFWCGNRVTGVSVCNGDRLTPQNRHHAEPLTGWRRSQAQEKKLRLPTVYMPREHEPQRAIWRGLQSLLPGSAGTQGEQAAPGLAPMVLDWIGYLTENVVEPDHPVHLRTIGMTYGSQSSVTDEITDDALALRAVLLSRDATPLVGVAIACVTAADKAARALGTLAGTLATARGGEPDGPRTRATELAYAELDTLFRRWLAELASDTEPSAAQAAWHRQVHGVILPLGQDEVARAPMSALVGHMANNRLVTSAHAEQRFRRDLYAAVPLAYPDRADHNE
jgi:CRISPR system Cascade subunit CasA